MKENVNVINPSNLLSIILYKTGMFGINKIITIKDKAIQP